MENKAYMNVKMALLGLAFRQERRETPLLALTSCRDGMGSDLRRGSHGTSTLDWAFHFVAEGRREDFALQIKKANVWGCYGESLPC